MYCTYLYTHYTSNVHTCIITASSPPKKKEKKKNVFRIRWPKGFDHACKHKQGNLEPNRREFFLHMLTYPPLHLPGMYGLMKPTKKKFFFFWALTPLSRWRLSQLKAGPAPPAGMIIWQKDFVWGEGGVFFFFFGLLSWLMVDVMWLKMYMEAPIFSLVRLEPTSN